MRAFSKVLLGTYESLRIAMLSPCYIAYLSSRQRATLDQDIDRWMKVLGTPTDRRQAFIHLMRRYGEFRSLVYYRVPATRYFKWFVGPGMPTLFIWTPNIGPGLFIQHGFATAIMAKAIGKNCWINQQVTIGFTQGAPVLGDNVMIHAGAIVVGKIRIGNNAVVGAGAVVVKDVPPDCTVVGNPAYIVKRNGVRCRDRLCG